MLDARGGDMRFLIMLFIFQMFFYGCDKEISVTPPDPDPPRGEVTLLSKPEGYSVFVDGKISGSQTPVTFKFMEEKEYSCST